MSAPLLQDYARDDSVVISESFLETFMGARQDFPSGETWDFVHYRCRFHCADGSGFDHNLG